MSLTPLASWLLVLAIGATSFLVAAAILYWMDRPRRGGRPRRATYVPFPKKPKS